MKASNFDGQFNDSMFDNSFLISEMMQDGTVMHADTSLTRNNQEKNTIQQNYLMF